MMKYGKMEIQSVLSRLKTDCGGIIVLVGFDGYVDRLYRVVMKRSGDDETVYFSTIEEYGQRIAGADTGSADIDLHLQDLRFGGNAPLMADGLAALGDKPVLIGALGWPEIDPAFQDLDPRIEKASIADPCQTIALEFNDGKIMMGDTKNGEAVSWNRLMETIGEDGFASRISRSELAAVLNWSALQGVTEIVRETAARLNRDQVLFLDISDPTSLPAAKLDEMLQVVRETGAVRRVVLGLNENEALLVMKTLFPMITELENSRGAFERYGEALRDTLNLECLTIHTNTYAMGFTARENGFADGFFVDKTQLSTGAGDHYNAAFCHGYMRGWTLGDCLTLASAASSYYVKNGKSAGRGELAAYLAEFGGISAEEDCL